MSDTEKCPWCEGQFTNLDEYFYSGDCGDDETHDDCPECGKRVRMTRYVSVTYEIVKEGTCRICDVRMGEHKTKWCAGDLICTECKGLMEKHEAEKAQSPS